MPRLSREFVKLETRLLNDHRFFTMSEFEQLVYMKLLCISRANSNKIPKKTGVLRECLRTNRSSNDIESALKRIKRNFPKFKENKYFMYFEDYELRLKLNIPNLSQNKCEDEDKDVDKDKEEDKDKEQASPALKAALNKVYKEGLNVYALTNKLKKQLHQPSGFRFPEDVLLKVCEVYDKDKGNIKNEWAWFTKVIREESARYFANKNISEHKEIKDQGTMSMKQIMEGMR